MTAPLCGWRGCTLNAGHVIDHDLPPREARPLVPSVDAATTRACEGCGRGLSALEGRWPVCLECTRARHRAVIARGKCRCGKKAREGERVTQGGRMWIPCRRCLGWLRDTSVTP